MTSIGRDRGLVMGTVLWICCLLLPLSSAIARNSWIPRGEHSIGPHIGFAHVDDFSGLTSGLDLSIAGRIGAGLVAGKLQGDEADRVFAEANISLAFLRPQYGIGGLGAEAFLAAGIYDLDYHDDRTFDAEGRVMLGGRVLYTHPLNDDLWLQPHSSLGVADGFESHDDTELSATIGLGLGMLTWDHGLLVFDSYSNWFGDDWQVGLSIGLQLHTGELSKSRPPDPGF